MTVRTPRPPRALFGVRALVPLSLLSLLTAPIPAAHGQEQLWLTQFGTSERESAYALAPDGAGGVMVAGGTSGSLGGPNAGLNDAFLARYDGAGNQLWIRQFGTSEGEIAWALAPDGAGGVFIAGHTNGSLGGPTAGPADVFLARYDSAGNRLWIRKFGYNVNWSADWTTHPTYFAVISTQAYLDLHITFERLPSPGTQSNLKLGDIYNWVRKGAIPIAWQPKGYRRVGAAWDYGTDRIAVSRFAGSPRIMRVARA